MRDLLMLGGGRIITTLIALISIRLSTTILQPDQYGLQAMLVTFQVFCGLFLVNPVGQYINRHTYSWADDGSLLPRLRRYRAWVLFAALSGAITSGVWSLTQPFFWAERLQITAIVALMVVASTWNSTSVSLLNMLGYRAQSVAWGSFTALISLSSSFILVAIFDNGIAWFAGQAVGMTIGAIGAGHAVRHALPRPLSGPVSLLETTAVRDYILPLAFATAPMWWLQSGYRLMIEANWGLVTLGYAAVGLTLAAQLWSVAESLATQLLLPFYYRRISSTILSESTIAYSDLLNTLGPIYLVLAAASLAGAPLLLELLVDSAYLGALPFLLMGAIFECSRALGNLLSSGAQINQKMSALIPAYALGAFTVTAGILISTYTSNSVQLAIEFLAISGIVTLTTMAFYMWRLNSFQLDWKRWLAGLSLLLASTIATQIAPLTPKGLGKALLILITISLFTSLSIIALLWNNPSTRRLINVRLNKK